METQAYVKNDERYIEKCLRSVMEQTLRDIEIIVVDGGSTDETPAIIQRLSAEDDRICVMEADGSVGAQFNLALSVAKGDYIAVCEGDDYIFPDKYEKIYAIAKEHRVDLIRAGYFRFFEQNGKEYRNKVITGSADFPYDTLLLFSDRDVRLLSLGINGFWSGIYNRTFLERHHIRMNETSGASYQDITFSFLSLLYAKRVYIASEALHCYRYDNAEASVYHIDCVERHFREYALLMNRLKKDRLWEGCKEIFFSWELSSYQYFMGYIRTERKRAGLAIYEELSRQMKEDPIEKQNMPMWCMPLVDALLIGEDAFTNALLLNTKTTDAMIAYFRNAFLWDERIVIFGAGEFGRIIFDYGKEFGKDVSFVDNSREMQREEADGDVIILPPESLRNELNDRVIIANTSVAKQMKEQVLSYGIEEEKIIVCDNEELFLREVFAKKHYE